MESALYGIYALVVYLSEILIVRWAHSFDFWYVNNSCLNTVQSTLTVFHKTSSNLALRVFLNFFSASIREGRVALSVGHPRGTLSCYVIDCCPIPLGICGLKNNSRRITYGIGCVRRMPSLSPLSSLGGKWIVAKLERFVLTRRAGSVLWWMTLSDYFGTQPPV